MHSLKHARNSVYFAEIKHFNSHASFSGAEKSHSWAPAGPGADTDPELGALGHQQASPSYTSDVTARVLGAWGSGSSPSIRRQRMTPPPGQHCHWRLGHPQPPPQLQLPRGRRDILWSFPHGVCPEVRACAKSLLSYPTLFRRFGLEPEKCRPPAYPACDHQALHPHLGGGRSV